MDLTCPSCGKAFPEGAAFCPSCGAPRESSVAPSGAPVPAGPGQPKKKMETWMIVLLVCAVGGGVCFCIPVVAAIAIPNLLAAKLSANETAAIATLRNLAACQAQVQTSGKIDADGDGIGEHGTLLEMTGSSGVRLGFVPADGEVVASSGFEETGDRIDPPVVSSALKLVDGNGVVQKSGYCFILYLPDSSKTGGWTHETGPAEAPGLEGGTGRVGVDASEIRWCAYAWPMAYGNSGRRAFFISNTGDVFESPNEQVNHGGPGNPPLPDSAFAPGKDGPLPGAAGNDGDVWTFVN